MAGTLNALGLLFVIGLTVVMLRKYGRFPKRFMSVLFGLLIAGISLIIASIFTTVSYSQPFTQIIIPCACFALCYAAFEDSYLPQWVLVVLFFIPLVLGFQFSVITSGNGCYTGIPGLANRAASTQQHSNLKQLKVYYELEFYYQPAVLNHTYPSGPFSASEAYQVLIDHLQNQDDKQIVAKFLTSKEYHPYRLWHTWLTGIYGQRSRQLTLWYPGGKLKDAVERLEYR